MSTCGDAPEPQRALHCVFHYGKFTPRNRLAGDSQVDERHHLASYNDASGGLEACRLTLRPSPTEEYSDDNSTRSDQLQQAIGHEDIVFRIVMQWHLVRHTAFLMQPNPVFPIVAVHVFNVHLGVLCTTPEKGR